MIEQRNRTSEIAVLAFACALPTVVTLAYFVWSAGLASGVQQVVFGTAKVVQFALPAVWVLLIRRERIVWKSPTRWGTGVGLAFGAVIAIGVFAVGLWWLPTLDAYRPLVDAVRAKVTELRVDTPLAFAMLGVFYALVHALLEEYYWRWFVFGRMRTFVSPGWAIAISSLAFAAHHVVVLHHYFAGTWLLTAAGSLAVAIGGAFWAWLYHCTRELWSPWWSHLLVDAAIFGVGYWMLFGGVQS